jgi:hypothetical protein
MATRSSVSILMRASAGDADAGGAVDLVHLDAEGFAQRRQDPRGDDRGLGGAEKALDQHRELVAADPRHGVGGPQALGQAVSDLQEEPIADLVAEGVVDDLEAVEVQVEHRQAEARLALHALPRVPQPVEEEGAVGQAGERVVEGAVLDARLQRGALLGGPLPRRQLEPQLPRGARQLLGALGDLLVQGAAHLLRRRERALELRLPALVLPAQLEDARVRSAPREVHGNGQRHRRQQREAQVEEGRAGLGPAHRHGPASVDEEQAEHHPPPREHEVAYAEEEHGDVERLEIFPHGAPVQEHVGEEQKGEEQRHRRGQARWQTPSGSGPPEETCRNDQRCVVGYRPVSQRGRQIRQIVGNEEREQDDDRHR